MPFAYYNKLSARDKRTYRKSDKIQVVKLPPRRSYAEAVSLLERTLEAGNRSEVQHAANLLCLELTNALGVEPARVKVLAVRPSYRDGSELHGLYTAEEGERPVIEVWMRTARHKRVVAFRTFLRTLLHEVLHHLDFALYGLRESFHTEGFFRRESSLFKQIVPGAAAGSRGRKKPERRRRPAPASRRRGRHPARRRSRSRNSWTWGF